MRLLPSILVATVLGLGAVGCGGGDSDSSPLGLDRSKYLDELSMDEIRQFCTWTESLAEPGPYQCADGNTMIPQTASECIENAEKDPSAPHCLVSLAEDCYASAAGDPCLVNVTAPCKTFAACIKQK